MQQLNPLNEQIYRTLFGAAPIGVAIETMEGRPLYANSTLCSMLGFSEDEMRSRHCVEFSPSEDADKDRALFQQLRQGLIDNYRLEKRFFRKDGTLIWGRLSIALMTNRASRPPLVVAMVEDITDKKGAEEKLQQSEADLRHLAIRLIQAQDAERQRIARELHDDFGQRLSLLVVGLDELRHTLPSGQNSLNEVVSELYGKVDQIAMDLQNLSRTLHSSGLQFVSLPIALRQLCERNSIHHHVVINFRGADWPANLPSGSELCVYRIAQEAVNNAIKHSHAPEIFVELTYIEDTMVLKVTDFGVGFDPSASYEGIGLATMQERLRIFGGELIVDSITGRGTTVIAQVKLEKTHSATTG